MITLGKLTAKEGRTTCGRLWVDSCCEAASMSCSRCWTDAPPHSYLCSFRLLRWFHCCLLLMRCMPREDSKTVNVWTPYLHPNSQNGPKILFDLIKFDAIINFLFGASKEAAKRIDKLISNWASTQVVPLVFHWSNLGPLVFFNWVLLNRIQPLFSWKSSEDKHSALADGNCMSVSTLVHCGSNNQLIFLCQINSSIFLWRGSPSGY